MSTEEPVAAKWARYSDYEIVDGAVQPVQGAAIEFYDPWLEYIRQSTLKSGPGGPHAELLRLVREIEPPSVLGQFRPEDESRILRWCRAWGLLGIWHQKTLQVTFDVSVEESKAWLPNATATVVEHGYTSVDGVWEEYAERYRVPEPWLAQWVDEPDQAKLREQVTDHAKWRRPPTRIHREGIASSTYREDPAYAPNQAHPLSEVFWCSYQESLLEMWDAMRETASLLEGGSPQKLLGCSKPILEGSEREGPSAGWACPSLIAALGVMKVTDEWGGRELRRCKHCGRPFVAKNSLQMYCAPPEPCKETAKKKRYRSLHPDHE